MGADAIVLREQGVAILLPLFAHHGFEFAVGEAGHGSGGAYATGLFRKHRRALSFSVRWALGLVEYRLDEARLEHRDLLRALAPGFAPRYPGYAADPLEAFRDLEADLRAHGEVFLAGTDAALSAAFVLAMQLRPPSGFARIAGPRGV